MLAIEVQPWNLKVIHWNIYNFYTFAARWQQRFLLSSAIMTSTRKSKCNAKLATSADNAVDYRAVRPSLCVATFCLSFRGYLFIYLFLLAVVLCVCVAAHCRFSHSSRGSRCCCVKMRLGGGMKPWTFAIGALAALILLDVVSFAQAKVKWRRLQACYWQQR